MQPRYFFRLLDVVRRLNGNPLTPLSAMDIQNMGQRWGLSVKNAQRYVVAGRAVATVLAEDGLTLRLERVPYEKAEAPDGGECVDRSKPENPVHENHSGGPPSPPSDPVQGG